MRRIGWDIGGAHLKAAVAEDGRIVAVVQEPCALWLGLDRLDDAFAAILDRIGTGGRHRATMTGELVDLFTSRAEGVAALAARAARHLGADVTIYAGRAGQVAVDGAATHANDVASANWHATAGLTGAALGAALLIDMGSTTTDIIPVRAGAAAARGYSDAERLASGELVYTGVVRTPLMALAADIPFAGRRLGVMAEHFATTADIWRLLGRLPQDADQHGTADGRGKSVVESRLRLSRMVGVDVAEASETAWRDLAAAFAEAQIRRVHDAAATVLSGAGLPDEAPVVACGVGAFAIEEVARRLVRPCRPLAGLIPAADPALAMAAAACAPAAAMALS
ncbi:hydantoinase/oxoprolinase family protein [Prosthecodimorpha staleyi]|uniref:H4MPT-linked C1 transfer pathway protein n=1 Tax=Prosthecodimorpha staleyi TaxID=2840188 RepID=A0A947GGC7_9HYPH|nr:hydantoinase/oxoprolinase family protein [Prosthecodimorpha staleyi]MBT9291905.1 H4MPT-linked C1 transfer pathway protein [Prosthecodimorpha staleyi]